MSVGVNGRGSVNQDAGLALWRRGEPCQLPRPLSRGTGLCAARGQGRARGGRRRVRVEGAREGRVEAAQQDCPHLRRLL